MSIDIEATVNDVAIRGTVRPEETLLEWLREGLGLRGSVEGCGAGVCGTCTVLVDRRPVSSCLMLAANADGRAVTTIEGLVQDGELAPVQQAFLEAQAFQCGYCTAGMIMAVQGLLLDGTIGTDEEIRDYLSGNLCRCGTYEEVLTAVHRLVARSA
jgi:xanthine dehydrogenase YagT iron-sulfur-binding subunit